MLPRKYAMKCNLTFPTHLTSAPALPGEMRKLKHIILSLICCTIYCILPHFTQIDIIGAMVIVWREEGKSGLFCAVGLLCATLLYTVNCTHI